MSEKIESNIKRNWSEWPSILPKESSLRRPSLKWRLGSRIIVPTIGILSKIWTDYFNKTTIYNHNVLLETLSKHYENSAKKALITISNHSSCMDDPLMWGSLIPFKWHLNSHRHRWSAAAQEVCFSRNWHSVFFSMGKTFPIIRGKGIYQPAMDYALALLKEGNWLHFFPQGKVIITDGHKYNSTLSHNFDTNSVMTEQSKRLYELKWGLARLVLDTISDCDSNNQIDILPIYHIGMDDVLPNKKPYIPQVNKKVTFYVRDEGPIHFDSNMICSLITDFAALDSSAKRKKLMTFFEHEFNLIREKAIKVHYNFQNAITLSK